MNNTEASFDNLNFRHIEEASAIGLTLIANADKTFGKSYQNYKLYKCNTCSTLDYFQPQHIRRGNTTCTFCKEKEYEAQAVSGGYEILGKSEKTDGNARYFRKYKRISCGHICELRIGSVSTRIGNTADWKCLECYENKLNNDAVEYNMTYLGKSEDTFGVYRQYKFNNCGHISIINPCLISRRNAICNECVINSYRETALSFGIEYVGNADEQPDIKRKYRLTCGCLKDIRISHVRTGSFACTKHADNHYTKPSSIYLLEITDKDGFCWLKLGYAKSLLNRIKGYGLNKEAVVINLFLLGFDTGMDALYYEKKLHTVFKKFRLNKTFMEKYHKFNGHTECYDIKIKAELLNELKQLEHRRINE